MMRSIKKLIKNSFEYNNDIYKIKSLSANNNDHNNNLIVMTSINPTTFGEGKTTTLIGLVDAFNKEKKSAIGCLRQPSIGPYFGMKGGATGGGSCSIKNEKFINLGLTGDFDKIMLVNNLIVSIIENDYFQNNFDIDPKTIKWRRCVDLNDRSLREIEYKLKDYEVKSSFTITSASDIMALFSLCKNWEDFKSKIENAPICKNKKGKTIYIRDLNITESIKDIIYNSLNPNIVFTLRKNPIFMHGGPFANIAHGTNSLISTYEAIKNSEYTFIESGFGSDLGLEKFINIVSRIGNLKPKLAIYSISFKSLKHHGKNDFKLMINYLNKHINISKSLNINYVILMNKFHDDNVSELNDFISYARDNSIEIKISDLYNSLDNSKEMVDYIINNIKDNDLSYSYDVNNKTREKIENIAKRIYGASKVEYSKNASELLKEADKYKYYVCIAKDHKEIVPSNNILKINDIYINHAANLIVPICSNIFLMPGLPKVPRARSVE